MTDAEAWEEATKWFPGAWRRLRRKGFRGDHADDAKQELWLALHLVFKTYDPAKDASRGGGRAIHYAPAIAKMRMICLETGATPYLVGRWMLLKKGEDPARLGWSPEVAARVEWLVGTRADRVGESGDLLDLEEMSYDDSERLDNIATVAILTPLFERFWDRPEMRGAIIDGVMLGDCTLKDLSERFGFSRERIRQLAMEGCLRVRAHAIEREVHFLYGKRKRSQDHERYFGSGAGSGSGSGLAQRGDEGGSGSGLVQRGDEGGSGSGLAQRRDESEELWEQEISLPIR